MVPAQMTAGKLASSSGSRERLKQFFVGRSLETCIAAGRDNVLQLRLIAALMVVFGHSYTVLGPEVAGREPLHQLFPRMWTHGTGVSIFFTVSGFLITLSWLRKPDLLRFVRARFLRIWPALAVCIAITAFVIGPSVTTWPLRSYFLAGDAFSSGVSYFLHNAVLHITPFLPGVFLHLPTARYVNGSLWTLPYEATLYLCVAGVGMLRLYRFPWLTSIGIAAIFSWLVILPLCLGQPMWIGYMQSGFLGVGCIACLLRRHVPISTGLMLVVLVICFCARYTTHVLPATWLATAYFALWFCYVPRLPGIPRGLDLSYGTYLWAFPIQQILVMHGVNDPLRLAAYATPIAVTFGLVS
jgi:peptidoglycan/LPS O-acetylase OafA/YrhL